MQLTAITREQFADKTWHRPASYAYAAQYHFLPVTVAELAKLVPTMPMGFINTGDTFQLVALTSLLPGSNLYLTSEGKWIGDYIPAAIRFYPFQLAKPEDSEDSVLCYDTSSDLLGDAGEGEAFFDADGPSLAIKEIANVLAELKKSQALTQQLVNVLQAAGLIQPWPLTAQQGELTMPVEGLYRIDEVAMNGLPDETFLPLRKAGVLPLVYAQLFSMNQLALLPKAAELQAKIRKQQEIKAIQDLAGPAPSFQLEEGESFKFS